MSANCKRLKLPKAKALHAARHWLERNSPNYKVEMEHLMHEHKLGRFDSTMYLYVRETADLIGNSQFASKLAVNTDWIKRKAGDSDA